MVIAFLPCCTFNIFWLPDIRPPVALGKGPGESCRIIQQKPFILQFSLFFNLKNGWEIFKIGLCFLRKPISLSDQVGVVFWVYLLLELHSGPFSNHSPENFQKWVLLDHGVVDPYEIRKNQDIIKNSWNCSGYVIKCKQIQHFDEFSAFSTEKFHYSVLVDHCVIHVKCKQFVKKSWNYSDTVSKWKQTWVFDEIFKKSK